VLGGDHPTRVVRATSRPDRDACFARRYNYGGNGETILLVVVIALLFLGTVAALLVWALCAVAARADHELAPARRHEIVVRRVDRSRARR
jgi:hypothetical protein